MKDIMLDLETMGNSASAAIIAIGAVEFDTERQQIGQRHYQLIDLESATRNGGVMDAATVIWWLGQSDAARAALRQPGLHVVDALVSFARWLDTCAAIDERRIWGNGAAFDNAILATAYRNALLPQPWRHWNDRCYRTMKSLRPDVKMVRSGTHHNAVDDAESQARHLIEVLQ